MLLEHDARPALSRGTKGKTPTLICVDRPEVNQRISKAAHIKELNSEMDKLKEELFATREKNGVYLPADHWESMQVCLTVYQTDYVSTAATQTRLSLAALT